MINYVPLFLTLLVFVVRFCHEIRLASLNIDKNGLASSMELALSLQLAIATRHQIVRVVLGEEKNGLFLAGG